MSAPLAGRIAVVSGASGGIGAATVIELAALGAQVVGLARRRDALEDVVDAARSAAREHNSGGTAEAVVLDVTDADAVQTVIGAVVDRLGGVDIVVVNAGRLEMGAVQDSEREPLQAMVDVNVDGVLNVVHSSLPRLIERADIRGPAASASDLVFVGSVAGRLARPGSAVYSMTKHALSGFAESLRGEVADQGVRVCIVQPGATDTEIYDHLDPAHRERVTEMLGEAVVLEPHDVAAQIAYVVSRPARVAIGEIVIRPAGQVS